jgi:PKD domain/Polysaccharide lyase
LRHRYWLLRRNNIYMKPRYLVFNYKTVVVTLLTVLLSSIIFVACKKDNSIENSGNDPVSAERYGSGNQAPKAKAGNDQTITLPATLNLDGSGSSDADGSIASYQWTQEVGPSITIASPASAQTAVTGLTGGSYRFRLTVTDNKGSAGTDTVHVTINGTGGGGTNQSPTVNAGTDQTITLPVSSVSLSGTGSDPDGTIASYLWTKVSGSGGTITTATAAATTITGLTAGSYVFSLKATDNQGATATDNITITVNGGTNQSPTVNAGADQTITLPVSSVSFSGAASDPDGTIASYLWSKVSGSGGMISSANSASTSITGLIAGSYVFSLKVTDNGGATATDNVTVTVNSATQGGTGYTLTYSNGYNTSSDISSNQLGRGGLSTSLYNAGPGSFRSEVRAGDDPISSGWRSEQQYDGSAQNPTEGAVEYDVYYETWGGFDGGGHSIQWHPLTSGASAIISLQNYGGKFDVVRDPNGTVYHQSGTLKTCASNTWYHLRWEYKWSTGSDGYIKLYIDNTLYYSFTGATADGSGQYLKVGQNRWPSGSGNMQTTSVCYYDNLTIYKKG